jgi:hypothetical protein
MVTATLHQHSLWQWPFVAFLTHQYQLSGTILSSNIVWHIPECKCGELCLLFGQSVFSLLFVAKLKFPQYLPGNKERGNHMKFVGPDPPGLHRSRLAVKIAEKLREA